MSFDNPSEKQLIKDFDNFDKKFERYQPVERSHHRAKVLTLSWNRDGKYLASGAMDGGILVYRVESSSSFKEARDEDIISLRGNSGHKGAIEALAWHPDNSTSLASASHDASVYLWDIKSSRSGINHTGNKPFHIIKTSNPLSHLVWSSIGTQIAIADKENNITIVDGRKFTEVTKRKMEKKIYDIAWTKDCKYIIVATKEGTVDIFESSHLNIVHSFVSHTGSCSCIKICHNNKYIATGGADAIVSLWDYQYLTCLKGFSGFDSSITSIDFNGDSTLLACSSEDLFIDIIHIPTGKALKKKIETKSSVNCVTWNPKTNMLAYCTNDKRYDDKDAGNLFIWGKFKER